MVAQEDSTWSHADSVIHCLTHCPRSLIIINKIYLPRDLDYSSKFLKSLNPYRCLPLLRRGRLRATKNDILNTFHS